MKVIAKKNKSHEFSLEIISKYAHVFGGYEAIAQIVPQFVLVSLDLLDIGRFQQIK